MSNSPKEKFFIFNCNGTIFFFLQIIFYQDQYHNNYKNLYTQKMYYDLDIDQSLCMIYPSF